MANENEKIVSISFNNKQFMEDVADTIDALEKLNNAASGKNIDTSSFDNLRKSFHQASSGISEEASSVASSIDKVQKAADGEFKTGGIDALRKALENAGVTAVDVEDTITTLQQLSKTGVGYSSDLGISAASQNIQEESANARDAVIRDTDEVSNHFTMLEAIGVGAMLAIGEKAVELGSTALHELTSGVRDGWAEYNLLTDSTQTILANTQRWGTDINDVQDALGELNHYADKTIYAFSDMTRNIGYFTTAGINLEDSVMAIKGMANLGAYFGADTAQVARATYQMSQAMSAGVIKRLDWRSLETASMAGKVFQDQLVQTAATMSGMSVDAMQAYVDKFGSFQNSLQEGWLTADVFTETLRKFAGESREYWESLTDESGNRLYTDKEIDELIALGQMAEDSATKVRTWKMMMDGFKESIGSGWQQTFSLIIGNLEEAKEFWTPINDILTSLVNGFFDLQIGALELWRTLGGREEMMEGLHNILTSISDVLTAIGKGFSAAFGGVLRIGSRLTGITEMFTDFTETLILSEEELGFLKDFFEGLFEPISLIVDVIFELMRAFFNAGDAVEGVETTADSLYSGMSKFRKALLTVLGYIGSVLKKGTEAIRNSKIIRKVMETLAKVVSTSFGIITRVIGAPFVLLYQLWERYNIGEKLEEFWLKVATFFLPIIDAVKEVKNAFEDWFNTTKSIFGGTLAQLGGPLEVLMDTFGIIKRLFLDLFDPTISISEAFSNFTKSLKTGSLNTVIEAIKTSFEGLWNTLKNTTIGQWIQDLIDKIQNAWTTFSQTPIGQKISEIVENVKDFIGIDTGKWDTFWETTKNVVTTIADNIATGWEKIKGFFTELVDIVKEWFGLNDEVTEAVGETTDGMSGAIGDGLFQGQIADLGIVGQTISDMLIDVSYAAATAEKNTPDPKTSKFLNFLKELPEKISSIVEGIKNSQLVKNVKELFNLAINPIKSFFSEDVHDQKGDLLDWLSGLVEKIEVFISKFLGIEDFTFENNSIFEIIASIFESAINTFRNIDPGVWESVSKVIDTITSLGILKVMLNLTSMGTNIAKGLKAAGKGWGQAQKAKINLAKAAKFEALAKIIRNFALGIVGIAIVIVGIASLIKYQGYGKELLIATALIVGIGVAIFFAIKSMINSTKDLKPGQVKGVHTIFGEMSKLLLSIGLSVAVLFGVTYLVSKWFENYTSNMTWALIAVGAAFAVVIGLVALLVVFSQKLMKNQTGMLGPDRVDSVGQLFEGISKILTSMVILVGGLVASIMIFTYFMDNLPDNSKLWIAIAVVVGILAVAFGATFGLVKIAEKMSAATDRTSSKTFSKIMLTLTVFLTSVMVGILLLVGAMAALVYLMDYFGKDATKSFILAGVLIAGLILAVSIGINLIVDSIRKLSYRNQGTAAKSLGLVTGMVIIIGVAALGLVYAGSLVSNTITDLTNFIGVMATVAVLMVGVIGMMLLVINVISNINSQKMTEKRIEVFRQVLTSVMIVMLTVSAATSLILGVMGITNSSTLRLLAVAGSILAMLSVVMLITGALAKLLSTNWIEPSALEQATKSMIMVALSVIGISGAMSLLMLIMPDATALWNVQGSITVLLTIMTLCIAGLSLIANMLKSPKILLVAAGSMVIASASIMIISAALAKIAKYQDKLGAAYNALMSLFTVMSVALLVFSVIGFIPGGPAILIAASAAMLIGAMAIYALSSAILNVANAIDVVVKALIQLIATLKNFSFDDIELMARKVQALIGIIKMMAKALLDIAPVLGEAIYLTIKSILIGLNASLIESVSEGISAVLTAIGNNVPLFISVVTAIGMALLTAVHEVIVALVNMISEDLGPGGIVRTLADSIADFISWLGSKMTDWGMNLVEALLDGLIDGFSDGNRIEKLKLRVELLFWEIRQNLLNAIGVPDIASYGATIALNLLNAFGQKIAEHVNDSYFLEGLDVLGVDTSGFRNWVNETAGIIDTAYNMALEDTSDGRITAIQEELNRLNNLNNTYANTAYNPTDYYRSISGAADEATESSTGFFDTVGDKIRNLGSSIFGDGFSFDLGSIFGSDGESGGGITSILGGLGNIGDLLGNLDLSSMLSFDTSSLSETSLGLGNITDMLGSSDFQNPVITPLIDDTEFSLGLDNMESLWNSHNFDELSLDVGNSMLLREQAEGDAESSGSVTYNFTQINNSPEALSPIQIYRDTDNLVRGRINR